MLRLYTHPACLEHDPGPGHPESPQRLQAVLNELGHEPFALLDRVQAPRATREQLLRVHQADHVDRILDGTPHEGQRRLDEDTVMSPGSAEAALRAAGAATAAVDVVLQGTCQQAFCAVRPPGHHATANRAMGFCLFNNVAVAAAHALAVHGLERVAIADFDVHHGNGTQDIFAAEPRMMYASSHQMPLYPSTGAADEHGVGNIHNAPLPPGADSQAFHQAWEDVLLPQLDAFSPQLLLISAGFDAHRLDPLADLQLDTDDYAWISRRLIDLARRYAHGRIVSCLEGGYNLDALRAGVTTHVTELLQA